MKKVIEKWGLLIEKWGPLLGALCIALAICTVASDCVIRNFNKLDDGVFTIVSVLLGYHGVLFSVLFSLCGRGLMNEFLAGAVKLGLEKYSMSPFILGIATFFYTGTLIVTNNNERVFRVIWIFLVLWFVFDILRTSWILIRAIPLALVDDTEKEPEIENIEELTEVYKNKSFETNHQD